MLADVQASLAKKGLDALYVSKPANVRYLSGFSSPADGRVILTTGSAILFTDSRYEVQTKEECFVPVRIWKGRDRMAHVRQFLQKKGVKALGYESDHLSISGLDQLRKASDCKLRKTTGIVEEIRKVKRPEEVRRIRRAAAVNDQAFEHILTVIKPGLAEIDVALEMEWFLRKHAAFHVAFDLIVASGPNGAKPHAQPSKRKIRNRELVTLDFGSISDGYCSDITRTVAVGNPTRRLRAIYKTVREGQEAGLAEIRPGIQGEVPDTAARKVIRKAGYGRYFGHGLGHGVGLEVHEAPRLAQRAADLLRPGMVVTCEPGIYIPNLGGVRIEDLVLVTDDGGERLSLAPKELICL